MIDFKSIVTPDRIRNILRDKDELNILLNNEEQFSDEEIYDAAEYAQDEIYSLFPALINKDSLPKVAVYYITISYLLMSVSTEELRNQMRIDDDNVGNIDYSNKSPQYIQIAQAFKGQAKDIFQTYLAGSYYSDMWGANNSISFATEGDSWL